MISPTTPSEKRLKSPLYYLWTKWNQPTHDGKSLFTDQLLTRTPFNLFVILISLLSPISYTEKAQCIALSAPHKPPFGAPLEEVIHYSDHGLSIPNTVQLCFTEIMKRGKRRLKMQQWRY